MKRLLKGGRVVDPANGRDAYFDVLIDGDRISRVGRDIPVEAGMRVVEIPAGVITIELAPTISVMFNAAFNTIVPTGPMAFIVAWPPTSALQFPPML